MQRRGNRGAVEILKQLKSGEIPTHEVSLQERRACVAYLRLEGFTQEEIAEIFRVHRQTVARDERANRKWLAKLVGDIDEKAVAGGLIASGKHLFGKAMKEKDYALAWRIERELMGDLQSLGYLPKAAERHEVQISTFTDLAKAAAQEGEQEQAATEMQTRKELPAPEAAGKSEEGRAPKGLLEPEEVEQEGQTDPIGNSSDVETAVEAVQSNMEQE